MANEKDRNRFRNDSSNSCNNYIKNMYTLYILSCLSIIFHSIVPWQYNGLLETVSTYYQLRIRCNMLNIQTLYYFRF